MITKLNIQERLLLTLEIDFKNYDNMKEMEKEENDNEAEYLGKTLSHPRNRFKRYNKVK